MDNRRGGIRRQHSHNNREYSDHDADHIKNDANSLERGMFILNGNIVKTLNKYSS